MWTCSTCQQTFINTNQVHSCGERVLADFLEKKSAHTVSLFQYFVKRYNELGDVSIQPTKSMIAFAGRTRFAYVTRLGKDFVDIVFPFQRAYADNLCFHKIAKVPGSQQFNHHFRLCREEDINEEVLHYMKLAYLQGSK